MASDTPIHVAVLGELLDADHALTADVIATRCGVDAAAIGGAVGELEAQGCQIENHPQQGLRLGRASLACWADLLETRHGDRLARRVMVFGQTASTQDVAKQMVAGAGAGACGQVVLADYQEAGRGRLGRRWACGPGQGVLMTVITEPAAADRLMLASCCGVTRAVEALGLRGVGIRWPNDLLVGNAKLAGLLVESNRDAALIGIGLNVAGVESPEPGLAVASLADCGVVVDRLRVIDRILSELGPVLHNEDDSTLQAYWRDRSTLLQKRITVETDGRRLTGRVVDLDPARGLILEAEGRAIVHLPARTTSLVSVAAGQDGVGGG